MKLHPLAIKRAVFQIDFPAQLAFYSEAGRLASRLQQDYKTDEYSSSTEQISLRSTKTQQWFFLNPNRIRVMSNDVQDFSQFRSLAIEIVSKYTNIMKTSLKQTKTTVPPNTYTQDATRLGTRLMHLIPVETDSFDTLNSRIVSTLLNGDLFNNSLYNDHHHNDTALVLEYRHAPFTGHIEIGPLTSQEVAQRFDITAKQAPEYSVLIDCDYAFSPDKQHPPPRLPEFLTASYKAITMIAEKLYAALDAP